MHDNQKIVVIVPDNPKREGTAAYDLYEQYKKATTIGEYKSAVRASADERVRMGLRPRADQGRAALVWDIKHKFIRLE